MDNLQTTRLLIRPFTLNDLEAVHALLDLDLEWSGPQVSLEQRREKLRFQISLAQWAVTGGIYGDRAIILKEKNLLIGVCGFRPWICSPAERAGYRLPEIHNHPGHSLELGVGYALSSQHRGQGYASEAVKALVEYGFSQLHLQRIVALTERGNLGSVKVMQRAGMRVGLNPDPEATYPWAIGVIENINHDQTT